MTGIYIKDEVTNLPVADTLVEFFDTMDRSAGWYTDINGYVTHALPGCWILGCVGDWSGKVQISKTGYVTKTIFTVPEGTVFISLSSSAGEGGGVLILGLVGIAALVMMTTSKPNMQSL